jgi:hypothetical protein
MNHRTTAAHGERSAAAVALRAAAGALALLVAAAAGAGAQAWTYPSFQQPRVTPREYNFGIADGGAAGTSFLFQWREGVSQRDQLSLDVGLADPDCTDCDNVFLVGGQYAHQLTTSTAQMPFDMLFTASLNGAFGNGGSLIRVPVGVSIGHRFPLEGGMAITPYAHPRLSFDFCNDCNDNSDVNLNFDIGANFDFSPQFSLRVSALFNGGDYALGDDNAIGFSLAWRPPGLR